MIREWNLSQTNREHRLSCFSTDVIEAVDHFFYSANDTRSIQLALVQAVTYKILIDNDKQLLQSTLR